jgi:hypothetical protein
MSIKTPELEYAFGDVYRYLPEETRSNLSLYRRISCEREFSLVSGKTVKSTPVNYRIFNPFVGPRSMPRYTEDKTQLKYIYEEEDDIVSDNTATKPSDYNEEGEDYGGYLLGFQNYKSWKNGCRLNQAQDSTKIDTNTKLDTNNSAKKHQDRSSITNHEYCDDELELQIKHMLDEDEEDKEEETGSREEDISEYIWSMERGD